MTKRATFPDNVPLMEPTVRAAGAGVVGLLAMIDPVLAASAAAGTEGAMLAIKSMAMKIQQVRTGRAIEAVEQAAHQSNLSEEEFAQKVCASEKLLDTTVMMIESSMRTSLKAKVKAMASLVNEGVSAIADEDRLAAVSLKIGALSNIEEEHLKLLILLDQQIPGVAEELGWKEHRIIERLPQYEVTLPALTAILSGAGLIFNNAINRLGGSEPIWKVTTLGESCLEMLIQAE